MKRISLGLILVLLLLLLCSCGHQQDIVDFRTLSFPGTTWDMTPEEIIEAFNLKEDDYETVLPDEGNPYYQLNKIHIELFGSDSEVMFAFEDINGDGTPHLRYVYAAYPDETDFDSVLSSMEKAYGEPESGKVYSWKSEGAYKDFMTEEDLELLSKRAEEAGAGPQDWLEDPISYIFLHIDSTRYKAYYNDTLVTNLIVFDSPVSAFTQEGGYSTMYPAS